MPGVSAILPHTLEPPPGLKPGRSVLDIGAGVRPMQWYAPDYHVCLEPFPPYCQVLGDAGFTVIESPAPDGLEVLKLLGRTYDAVYLLDVVEHLGKGTGRRTLELAQKLATVQVVVYTPDGFKEQTKDVWGYGGDYWQTHRSGWTEEDFPGWRIHRPAPGSLFAIWDVP